MLSLKIKLKLNLNQIIKLETLSNEHRMLYNFLLKSIKEKTQTFKEINQKYVDYRWQNQLTINSKSSQITCMSLINNIKSFYELRKKDITAKFPYRFKSYKYFTSFTHDYNNGMGGFKIKDNILILNLLSCSVNSKKLIIDLPNYCSIINNDNIKTITFKKEERDYYIIFVYSEQPSNKKLNKSNFMSIDLGYTNIVTSYSNNMNNLQIKNLKLNKLEKTIEHLQSLKDKNLKKYSNRYNKINNVFKRKKKKMVNKIIDFQHKISTYVVNECVKNDIGSLIVGDLKIKKIICKENKKLSGISKSTLALGRFKTFLEYKSKKANMDHYHVNEAYTSQQNCLTNEIMFSSKLDNRIVEIKPNLLIDRDLNSAINIAKKCKGVWFTHDLDFNLDRMYYNVLNDSMIRIEI